MAPPLLRTRQLSIGYDNHIIAPDLNLSLKKGELICLLGPNGAGKSTLMHTLAGLHPNLGGTLIVDGQPGPLPARVLAKTIAVVLSGFSGIGGIRVKEYIAMGRAPYSNWTGKLREKDRFRINEAMELTDTLGLASRNIGTLSDGEQQRVMIARALAQECPIIMLDEPTSHLDIGHRVRIMKLLYQLSKEQDKGILLSSHDLDLALQGADQLWILSDTGTMTTGFPADLVIGGQLADAYGTGGDAYDWEFGGIRLLPAGKYPVHLDMPSEQKRWVLSALANMGFREAKKEEPGPAISSNDAGEWQLILDGNSTTFTSVMDMVTNLRQRLDSGSER